MEISGSQVNQKLLEYNLETEIGICPNTTFEKIRTFQNFSQKDVKMQYFLQKHNHETCLERFQNVILPLYRALLLCNLSILNI